MLVNGSIKLWQTAAKQWAQWDKHKYDSNATAVMKIMTTTMSLINQPKSYATHIHWSKSGGARRRMSDNGRASLRDK